MSSDIPKRVQSPFDPNFEGLNTRAAARASRRSIRKADAETKKLKGNAAFREENYPSALAEYDKALVIGGPNAIVLCNLAATYLKMEMYEEAEENADRALDIDPSLKKARYRRGKARHALGRYRGALIDFETLLASDPNSKDKQLAQSVQATRVALRLGGGTESDDEYTRSEYGAPREDQEGEPSDAESDSSDCRHVGNGMPCRDYNHEGCGRGEACKFSHAPDKKSLRDNLGKNVCFSSLQHRCQLGDQCVYSHDRRYIPDRIDLAHVEDGMLPRQSKSKKGRSTLTSTMPSKTPIILVISLEFEDWAFDIHKHLINSLKKKGTLKIVKTATAALAQLSPSSTILGILIADAGIARPKHEKVLQRVASFATNGGPVVIGGQFSNHISPREMSQLFGAFGKPQWTMGEYHRTTFAKNTAHATVKANPSLPVSISIKTVHVGGIDTASAALYVATDESRLQSLVFPSVSITNIAEAPIVQTRVGKGYLGFVGDVNGEEHCTPIVLAMLGFLDGGLPESVDEGITEGVAGLSVSS